MRGGSVLELIVLLVTFALILFACVATTRFVAGRQMVKGKNRNMKPLETYQVAPNRYLQLLQIGERYIVISVCKDSVRFITEVKKEELVLADDQPHTGKSFKEILSEWKSKLEKG